MTEPLFATLDEVPLREAWAHEAQRFTPWLAANLERLSQAIGIPLELTGTEIGVGRFSADILARNPADDSVVLIENQLEGSDHTHLGQIMTYLAGLDAHTMIWVAPAFREEHLSAIRWLNEHTVDPFAFFAVKLRVVRIANSPLAPLFEVIERPNNWDRRVAEKKREVEGDRTELGQFRLDFWTHFCNRYPDEGAPNAASSRWVPLPGISAFIASAISDGISADEIGIFVRAPEALDRARSAAATAGVQHGATVALMHLAKGLEFKAVIAMACDDDLLPLASRIAEAADEGELDEIFETERQLLYVASTRARDRLLVCGVSPASEFIRDLRQNIYFPID